MIEKVRNGMKPSIKPWGWQFLIMLKSLKKDGEGCREMNVFAILLVMSRLKGYTIGVKSVLFLKINNDFETSSYDKILYENFKSI